MKWWNFCTLRILFYGFKSLGSKYETFAKFSNTNLGRMLYEGLEGSNKENLKKIKNRNFKRLRDKKS